MALSLRKHTSLKPPSCHDPVLQVLAYERPKVGHQREMKWMRGENNHSVSSHLEMCQCWLAKIS